MTEMEKLEAGLPYRYDDPALARLKDTASQRCARLNAIDPLDAAAREAAARELLGQAGDELDIQPGFHCDNGQNIRVGRRFTANFNVTILDGAPVTFGDYCMVGPGTLIATTGHPLKAQGRRERLAVSEPITVGDDVWIGGNCVITGGVAIGSNVVVAAGAVVTKDVPDNCVVAGVPARVIKQLG
ncbi:sugar O-acetyltransferase [Actinomyces sp. 186855]|nr:sugar O-acetyltransferase [Actinomyces sp. AC-20-1]MCL3790038.1 sugar O-acetyltransferase [Actinomyces sp. 187325]MCL3792727.1 sugar O-acetyltransferase [Actinomyces sp. 186855]MCL3793602.1 sugar O-acetyltransferase [Actinomyces sp. 217892]